MSGLAAAEPPFPRGALLARDFASGKAASEIHQSFHNFATRVHGFATKTKALAREIPPGTQAISSDARQRFFAGKNNMCNILS